MNHTQFAVGETIVASLREGRAVVMGSFVLEHSAMVSEYHGNGIWDGTEEGRRFFVHVHEDERTFHYPQPHYVMLPCVLYYLHLRGDI